ncbi:ATP/GTP-binding protein [Flavobacterium sp.]|jgi:AAA15 family ATPase/GTPase|uniref:ATP/GTP-binding protein n=1 Tax=Flavobacterium sp. TaxID=239 RepID=UPI0037C12D72
MSFKDDTEFNMLTSKGNGYKQHLNHLQHIKSGTSVLKTAAIYGANASGKSNLVNSINYLKEIVTNDDVDILVPLSKRFRLDENYKTKPTTFRIEFTYKDVHYDYALEIEKGKIKEEWLYEIISIEKEKEILLFERKNNKVTFGEYFYKNKIDISYIEKFLSKELSEKQCALNAMYDRIDGDEKIDNAFDAFGNILIVTPQTYNSIYPFSIMSNLHSKEFAENILKNSNTGIEKLDVQVIEAEKFFSYDDEDFKQDLIDKLENKISDENENNKNVSFFTRNEFYTINKSEGKYLVSILKTKHFNSDSLFEFNEESDGTNRLFELIPAFDGLTSEGNMVYIIDELERSLHPILAKELLHLFVNNSKPNSQLIFTTHETHLLDLDLLRQDEIWFTEKKIDGSSSFYPLSDYKPREDKNIRNGYLEGRYGGIPFLGDFSKLV